MHTHRRAVLILALIVASPSPAALAWDAGGTPVCTAAGRQNAFPGAIPDGFGGTLVAWDDQRAGDGGPSGTYLLRLGPDGERVPGWPANGRFVKAGGFSGLCSDGAGGAYLYWEVVRDRAPWADVLATRVLADGSDAPGWPADGVVVCDTTGEHRDPVGVPDGSGGLILVWRDTRDDATNLTDLYAQRLASDGRVADGWPRQGAPVTRSPLYEYGPLVAADGQGGAWIAWKEIVDGDGLLQHLGTDGQPVGTFPGNGIRVRPGSGYKTPGGLVAASDGSALVFWTELGTGGQPPGPNGLYACRFASDTTRAPGWPVTGRALPANTSGPYGLSSRFAAMPDGGAMYAWSDETGRIRAMRVDPEAQIAPGWPDGGALVCADSTTQAFSSFLDIAGDGHGGAFLSWFEVRQWSGGYPSDTDVLATHVLSGGSIESGWPASGAPVFPTSALELPGALVPDATGGVVSVFRRGPDATSDVYAARLVAGDVVAVQVSLVSAAWDGSSVGLEWQLGDPPAVVELERDAGAGWSRIARLSPDGSGSVVHRDTDVTPGRDYVYRLRWTDAGREFTGGETSVRVPGATLSLRVLDAGRARASLRVRLALATGAPARLVLFDVQGRRVLERVLDAGPAERDVTLPTRDLAAGLYLARVEQGARRADARAFVIR